MRYQHNFRLSKDQGDNVKVVYGISLLFIVIHEIAHRVYLPEYLELFKHVHYDLID